VPVSHAMTSKPVILPATDFPVRQAETLLDDNKFQGFPVVEDPASKILIGYIGRTELQYAINRAKREGLISPDAKCLFNTRRNTTSAMPSGLTPVTPAIQAFGFDSLSSRQPEEHYYRPPETFDGIATSSGARSVDFSRYVDLAPLTVHPSLPLETVMEIFKKMGPRVILVEHRGRLSGLVTVKDCLKYQFKVEAQEHAVAMATTAGGVTGEPGASNGGLEEGVAEQKLWEFIQWVVGKMGFRGRKEAARIVDSLVGERGGGHMDSLDIVDGTENVEGNVELEERGAT